MTIKKANQSDANVIYYMLNENEELKDFEEGEEYPKKWVQNIIKDTKNNLVLVDKSEKEIRGFLIAHLLNSIKDAILNHLYVKPDYRNKGIAKELLEKYEDYICTKGFLFNFGFVNMNNNARQFFKKRNFKIGNNFTFIYKEMNK